MAPFYLGQGRKGCLPPTAFSPGVIPSNLFSLNGHLTQASRKSFLKSDSYTSYCILGAWSGLCLLGLRLRTPEGFRRCTLSLSSIN